VLTEAQVQRSFRKMFQNAEITPELIEKAEGLIERLRLESPLRHRLTEQLDELRQMCVAKNA
jgi:hypothetical protein